MANIILTTMGTGGDVFPYITIGAALKARGHRVVLLTHSYYSDVARDAGVNFEAIDSLEESERMMRDGPLLNTPKSLLAFLDCHILPKIPIEIELIRKHYLPGETVLVARSGPGFAARMAAELMPMPLVSIFMTPADVLGLTLVEQLVNLSIGSRLNEFRRQLDLPVVERWEPWLRYQTGIGLWPDWYCSSDSTWKCEPRLAGFILSDDPAQGVVEDSLLQIMRSDRPVVLITGGTGVFGGSNFFEATIEAGRLAGCRVLVVSRHRELLPPRLPEDCFYFPRVPSLGAVMPHVSAICHHGGMGTIGQAIAAGIPQLISGAGGDRPDNAARLKAMGCAESVPPRQLTPERVAAALSYLMSSEAVRRCCQSLSARFRETSPVDLVCRVIEEAGRVGSQGSSRNANKAR
ncbi:MAG TPA: nucleotide disphospho-sugar-binding domain-containing protein [Blastocatellia bacterium]|nr:nucleotide disphospho-sugar-binding domain-containing protein [Blastocatellia bacterium]